MKTTINSGNRQLDLINEFEWPEIGAPLTLEHFPKRGLIVFIGAPGAGKSTLAWRLLDQRQIVSTDRIRKMLCGRTPSALSDAHDCPVAQDVVFSVAKALIDAHLTLSRPGLVISDSLNLDRDRRRSLAELAVLNHAPKFAVLVDARPEEASRRNRERGPTERVPEKTWNRAWRCYGKINADPESLVKYQGFDAAYRVDMNAIQGDANVTGAWK